MTGRRPRRKADRLASGPDGKPASPDFVKLCVRVRAETGRRLAIESAMVDESQSAIVERVLAAHLKGWRMPSRLDSGPAVVADPAGDAA